MYDNFDPELNGLSPRDLHATVINYQNVRIALTFFTFSKVDLYHIFFVQQRSPMRPDQLPSRWDQLDPIKADLLKSLCVLLTCV